MAVLGIGATPPPTTSDDGDAALRAAARQLEGIFVGLMFEEMAKTVEDSGLTPKAPGADLYQQWFRGAVAERWTANGGTGLGDQIAASLGASTTATDLRAAIREAQGKVGESGGLERPSGSARGPTHTTLPVAGPITSHFGERIHPVHGGHDEHRGVDIAVPVGTPVRLPFAGRVFEVGESPTLGRYVIVEHPSGYRSLFAHLSEVSVETGTALRAGEPVARSGNTGRSTGPHLHYGLYRDGHAVDPTPYLQ